MFGIGWVNADFFNEIFNWNLNHLALATTFGIIFGLMELAKPAGAGFFVNEPKSKQEKTQAKEKEKKYQTYIKNKMVLEYFNH
jgi:hypothetical protein